MGWLFYYLKYRYIRIWAKWKGKMRSFVEFPDMPRKTRRLGKIIAEYSLTDAYKAIFAIGIYYKNRSALSSRMSMNKALIRLKKSGNKRIDSYESFRNFFNRVEPILKIDAGDDPTLSDFGEVKLPYYGRKYSIIIGSGLSQVYENNIALISLAHKTGKERELVTAINYYSGLIDYFADCNKGEEDYINATFELPPQELFDKVCRWFEEETDSELYDYLYSELGKTDRIEKRHFTKIDDVTYPLWNEYFLVDLFSAWYEPLDKNKRYEISDYAVGNILNSLVIDPNDERLGIFLQIRFYSGIDDLDSLMFTFAYLGQKHILLGLNVDRYSSETVEKALQVINTATELRFAETFRRAGSEHARGLQIRNPKAIKVICYDSYLDINELHFLTLGRDDRYSVATALDLMDYLLFADSADEIVEYLNYDFDSEVKSFQTFGGDSARFFEWKKRNHMLSQGAIQYSFALLGHDTAAEYVFNWYKKQLRNYPWKSESLCFANPHEWLVLTNKNGYDEYVSKAVTMGGFLKTFPNGVSVFLVKHLHFFKDADVEFELNNITVLVEDIVKRMIDSVFNKLIDTDSIRNIVFELMYMPNSYAEKASKGSLLRQNREYIFSDVYVSEGLTIIRYTTNFAAIKEAIKMATDRSTEVDVFLELFAAVKNLYPEFYEEIQGICNDIKRTPKHVDLFEELAEGYWNDKGLGYQVSDETSAKAKKDIAKLCLNMGIEPGTYKGKDANEVIRSMQVSLITEYERYVGSFNQYDMHCKALEIYAAEVFEVDMQRKRYVKFEHLDKDIKNEMQQDIIERRERGKRNCRNLLYLIETNLSISHNSDNIIDKEQMEYLLGYTDWLVSLNDCADACHFTDKSIYFSIDEEFLVDIHRDDTFVTDYDERNMIRRVYNDQSYITRDDEKDIAHIENVKKAFYKDTEIDFEYFISFLSYLAQGNVMSYSNELRPNVFCADKEKLISDFYSTFEGKISCESIKAVLNYLTIVPDKIKTVDGKTLPFLQFGAREKRDNRFEVKSIWQFDDKVVFSPIVQLHIEDMWIRSFMDFFMPYEIGLSSTKKAIEDWKRLYEDKIVFDIEECFAQNGFSMTRHNMELWKVDREGKHPRNLGDYDVFAVDEKTKTIWIIECKVLGKVGSIFESVKQQEDFFLKKREDEKFQIRIDYLKGHYKEILRGLGIELDKEYSVVPYMVMNKVMVSQYKNIAFEILSYGELCERIKNR